MDKWPKLLGINYFSMEVDGHDNLTDFDEKMEHNFLDDIIRFPLTLMWVLVH